MRTRITTVAAAGALGVAGLAAAVGVGSVLAPATAATAPATEDGAPEEAAPDEQGFLAERLERLRNALQGLVDDGTITDEQADAVAEHLQDRRQDRLDLRGLGLDAAAETLGLSDDEVRDALRDGSTLADLAEQQGVDVATLTDALVAAAQERLDAAVADGRITQERADEIAAELPERLAVLVEEGPQWGHGPGRGDGPPPRGGAPEDAPDGSTDGSTTEGTSTAWSA